MTILEDLDEAVIRAMEVDLEPNERGRYSVILTREQLEEVAREFEKWPMGPSLRDLEPLPKDCHAIYNGVEIYLWEELPGIKIPRILLTPPS